MRWQSNGSYSGIISQATSSGAALLHFNREASQKSHLCQLTFPHYVHKQIILGEMWYWTLFGDAEDVTLDVFCSFDDGLSELYIPLEKLESVKLGALYARQVKNIYFILEILE